MARLDLVVVVDNVLVNALKLSEPRHMALKWRGHVADVCLVGVVQQARELVVLRQCLGHQYAVLCHGVRADGAREAVNVRQRLGDHLDVRRERFADVVLLEAALAIWNYDHAAVSRVSACRTLRRWLWLRRGISSSRAALGYTTGAAATMACASALMSFMLALRHTDTRCMLTLAAMVSAVMCAQPCCSASSAAALANCSSFI
ncbi:putative helicase [Shewanella phage SFCi1]|nr:putative helicase [Shewanella phage SFCi1]